MADPMNGDCASTAWFTGPSPVHPAAATWGEVPPRAESSTSVDGAAGKKFDESCYAAHGSDTAVVLPAMCRLVIR